jgi:hypothetical protein
MVLLLMENLVTRVQRLVVEGKVTWLFLAIQ